VNKQTMAGWKYFIMASERERHRALTLAGTTAHRKRTNPSLLTLQAQIADLPRRQFLLIKPRFVDRH
jgi:hypothetical protein